MGYRLNRLDEPVFMAVSKPLLTEFGIHHRLESCEWVFLQTHNQGLRHLILTVSWDLHTLRTYTMDHKVTVVKARFQVWYPFCSRLTFSASKIWYLLTFFSRNNFFQWDGSWVCLFSMPPICYIQTNSGPHYWIHLIICSLTKTTKEQKPQLHPDVVCLGQK